MSINLAFASADAAQDWVNARRGEGLASFMVTTPAGTSVESLDGGAIEADEPRARGSSRKHGGGSHARSGKSASHGKSHGSSRRHRR